MEPLANPTVAETNPEHHKQEDKSYIKSKMKWTNFKLHQDIIDALRDQGLTNPTRVQAETLEVTTNPDRKKFNMLIRAANGSGKTMSFLVPIINALQPGQKTAEDKML